MQPQHGLEVTPEDARVWLALGRIMELEGLESQSLEAYRYALSRVSVKDMSAAPGILWAGLARALLRVPGHDFEREWLAFARSTPNHTHAWLALQEAFDQPDRTRLRALLRSVMLDPSQMEGAAAALSRDLESWDRDPAGAFAVLKQSLERGNNAAAHIALQQFLLSRGRLEEARSFLRVGRDPPPRPRAD